MLRREEELKAEEDEAEPEIKRNASILLPYCIYLYILGHLLRPPHHPSLIASLVVSVSP